MFFVFHLIFVFYTKMKAYATAIITIDARKLHNTKFPKNTLFPSRSEIGIILKNAYHTLNLVKIPQPAKYPIIAKIRLAAIPAAAIKPI